VNAYLYYDEDGEPDRTREVCSCGYGQRCSAEVVGNFSARELQNCRPIPAETAFMTVLKSNKNARGV